MQSLLKSAQNAGNGCYCLIDRHISLSSLVDGMPQCRLEFNQIPFKFGCSKAQRQQSCENSIILPWAMLPTVLVLLLNLNTPIPGKGQKQPACFRLLLPA